MIYLKDYIKESRIVFLDTKTKKETIEELINTVKDENFIKDFEKFKEAVFERENIVSTSIGKSIAIPHVKIKEVSHFFISVGIHKKGIEWGALDKLPVKLIFLIGGPEDHKKYLRILAKLTLVLKNERIREKILNSENSKQVLEILNNY